MGVIASQITSLKCLLSRLFRHRSKKTSKLRVTGLCAGNSPGTSEFRAQMASNAENVSIWWHHHVPKSTLVIIYRNVDNQKSLHHDNSHCFADQYVSIWWSHHVPKSTLVIIYRNVDNQKSLHHDNSHCFADQYVSIWWRHHVPKSTLVIIYRNVDNQKSLHHDNSHCFANQYDSTLSRIQHNNDKDITPCTHKIHPISLPHRWAIGCLLWTLQWHHNERDGVSNHQCLDSLLNCLFRRRSKETSKLRVTGLCEWNSLVTGEFSTQRASNAEVVSIWWRHHVCLEKTDYD